VRGAIVKNIPAQNYFNTQFSIETNGLAPGIYYIKMNSEDLQVVKKLVIMR